MLFSRYLKEHAKKPTNKTDIAKAVGQHFQEKEQPYFNNYLLHGYFYEIIKHCYSEKMK